MQWQLLHCKGMASAPSRSRSSAGGMATATLQRDGESQAVAIAEATVCSTVVAAVTRDAEDGQKQEDMWILKHLVGPLWLES